MRRRCNRSAGDCGRACAENSSQVSGSAASIRPASINRPYVVDFFCAEVKLIVEVDGGQHADDGDARTRWLEARGYRVIRFWNNDVLANTEGVLRMILDALRAAPHPNLPLKGGGD